MKACAGIDLALAVNATAVALDHASHRRQADAVAFEVALHMQTLERREQPVCVGHVEAGAVVGHVEMDRAVRLVCADPNLRMLALGGELQRVAEQIDPDLANEPPVALEPRQGLDHDRIGG